jgi:hypothetical protein
MFNQIVEWNKNDVLTLEADDTHIVKWDVDAAFAVHDDFRSHTGATLTLGSGAILSASTKQKVNTRSSTEAELNGIYDYIAQVVWTKNFLEAQGCGVNDTIIYQDNTPTIVGQVLGSARVTSTSNVSSSPISFGTNRSMSSIAHPMRLSPTTCPNVDWSVIQRDEGY